MGNPGSFFAPRGLLSGAHPSYEHRPGQEAMAAAVEGTLRDGGVLMVEAGTGTGKTLAYLVPALKSGRRVIVSTGTKNLQDQIYNLDLPFLRSKAGLAAEVCLIKGRDNYLCRYRLAGFEREPLLEVQDEKAWLPKIRAWSASTSSGDRAEIPDLPDGLRMWRDVNARADTCLGTKCPEYEPCWLTQVKRRAQRAQIVVANHHLFFADLAVRTAYGSVLPDYDTVIFDEAHLLEEIATNYFGVQVSSAQVEDLTRGVETVVARHGGPASGGGWAARLREAALEFFIGLREHLGDGSGRVRFDTPDRGGPELESEWTVLRSALDEICRRAGETLGPGETVEALERRVDEVREALAFVLARADPSYVYGLEARGRGNVILSAAPIDVSGLLRESLFERLHACVLTSATLAVEGGFEFFQKRLGLETAATLAVESHFDHGTQAVLYLPSRMSEPQDPKFLHDAIAEIRELLAITQGRAFLLFTSYANMEQVRAALLREGSWPLLVQGDGSKIALVEAFKRTPSAVLLGTSSFWHGVDVPGEALSLVVIDRLPFGVPADPLIAARIARIRRDGGNPFAEYQTPMAVLELKQGLGRLLRSRADRGILAVLDPRLTTRSYGKTFLRSLPAYPIVRDLVECRRFFGGS